jgi:phosphatidylserine decarboxylase
MLIAREGWPYVVVLLVLGCLPLVFRFYWLGGFFLALAIFTLFFFRDPERVSPPGANLVLSAADGKVVVAGAAPDANPLGPGAIQISTFLSIFDVHVNRAPIAGRIAKVEYKQGDFLPAFDDKASLRNEQNAVTIEEGSKRLVFKQIAGLIARRIVLRKQVGDRVSAGERVGMIKFGSRVDVFMPPGSVLLVKKGDRVSAGVSILGECPR